MAEADYIDPEIAESMKRMVGFRNVAVHNYRELDLAILKHIVEHRLPDFTRFTEALIRRQ